MLSQQNYYRIYSQKKRILILQIKRYQLIEKYKTRHIKGL
jgi:hypothetical protein